MHPVVGRHHLAAARSRGVAQRLDRDEVAPELRSVFGAAEYGCGGTVGDSAAVEEAKRPGDDGSGHGLLDGYLPAEVGFGIERAVVMALDRDHGEVFLLRAVCREVFGRCQGVAARRRRLDAEHGMRASHRLPGAQTTYATVLGLLEADAEDEVIDPRGQGVRCSPDGLQTGTAEVLHPDYGDVVQLERIGETLAAGESQSA